MTESIARTLPISRAKRGRERGQNGTLQIVGKARKRWRGHYWVYETRSDGSEVRRHKAVVLGLRSEMTRQDAKDALRRVIIRQSDLKRPESTIDGQVYPTLKTKESRGFVALPASIRSGLAKWREMQKPKSEREFIFPNADGGVYRVDNYRADVLKPALKRVADETGITGIDFRACRRTCGTHLSQYGGVKEVQAHLRHARATTTLDIYIQEIPAAVRTAVEKLDAILTSGDQDSEDNEGNELFSSFDQRERKTADMKENSNA